MVTTKQAKKLEKLCGILTANTGVDWDWMSEEATGGVSVRADFDLKLHGVKTKIAIAYLQGVLCGNDQAKSKEQDHERGK